jgi:hypothetical protein
MVKVDAPGLVARGHLQVGDDAVHQHSRDAIERDDNHHTVEGLQKRVRHEWVVEQFERSRTTDAEHDLKAGLPVVAVADLDTAQRLHHRGRRRQRHRRADEQGEMDAEPIHVLGLWNGDSAACCRAPT